jgi:hypothetical protein
MLLEAPIVNVENFVSDVMLALRTTYEGVRQPLGSELGAAPDCLELEVARMALAECPRAIVPVALQKLLHVSEVVGEQVQQS